MYRVGIDLGGTNIAAGVVDAGWRLVSHVSIPTGAGRPADRIAADMHKAARMALEQAGLGPGDCEMVGVGAPGSCDVGRGVVARSYSLGWRDVPLAALLGQRWDVPVRVDNDANCAALGEVKAGAAAGCQNAVLITLGTGVGSGIVIGGRIYAGRGGGGTELGHTMLALDGELCSCGRRGCADAYVSATALIRRAARMAEVHPESPLGRLERITAKDVFDSADAGDQAALALVEDYCRYLSVLVCDIANALGPEIILIGGGISRQGERLLGPAREYAARCCFDTRAEALPVIKAAALGNEAGIIGAAAL